MEKRVMIVDDSRLAELQIGKILEGTGYTVAAYCRSGHEAIEQYGEVLPDVVTMDILMPDMDGMETARAILEQHPDARIIMISALAYDETLDEADAVGAKAFVYKPLHQEALLAAFEKALS